MLLACYSHKHISYRIRTIIRKAISLTLEFQNLPYTSSNLTISLSDKCSPI
ncbi:hypothetical protein [Wolbachia endosymbiont (group A) of Nomada hirtipes]|uniref:hypothetical protein n=1 Tax=Wolbachia endosymbiont (group A) of Nomada hirtipes TaxID=3066208 RepID=UPI0030CD4D82